MDLNAEKSYENEKSGDVEQAVQVHEGQHLQRQVRATPFPPPADRPQLKSRHIQMISIGGVIGTGTLDAKRCGVGSPHIATTWQGLDPRLTAL